MLLGKPVQHFFVMQHVHQPTHTVTPPRLVELCDHSFCQSVVLLFCEQDNSQHALMDVDQSWQAWATGDPLEVITVWC